MVLGSSDAPDRSQVSDWSTRVPKRSEIGPPWSDAEPGAAGFRTAELRSVVFTRFFPATKGDVGSSVSVLGSPIVQEASLCDSGLHTSFSCNFPVGHGRYLVGDVSSRRSRSLETGDV